MSDLLQSGNYSPGPQSVRESTAQPHPDADQLNAFVEHTLPKHERLATLAHLAECADCRKIVALSVPPLEDTAEVESEPVILPRFSGSLAGFFSGRKVIWIAAPALAAIVILSLHLRSLKTAQPRAAQVSESRPSAPPARPSSALDSPPPVAAPKRKAAPESPPEQTVEPKAPIEANKLRSLPPDGREPAIVRRAASTSSTILPPTPAPARSSQAKGGPVARQGVVESGLASRTAATAPPAARQSANVFGLLRAPVRAAPTLPQIAASKPSSAVPHALAPQPQRQTIRNQAYGAAPVPVVSADSAVITANAQPMQSSVATVGSEVVDGLAGSAPANAPRGAVRNASANASMNPSMNAAFVAMHAPLPSGRRVLSLAASLHLRLALDARNQLFFSGDDGQHWEAVLAVWRGRAVAVSALRGTTSNPPAPVLSLAVPERYTPDATASEQLEIGSESSLRGVVTDTSGGVIPGVIVIATDSRTNLIRSVETDTTGRYLLGDLPPGVYRLEAQAAGFQRQSQIVVIGSPQQAVINLVLPVGQTSQTVTVAASSAQLQYSSGSTPAFASKAHKQTPASPLTDLAPVFVITTDSGDRWTSPDGHAWKHE